MPLGNEGNSGVEAAAQEPRCIEEYSLSIPEDRRLGACFVTSHRIYCIYSTRMIPFWHDREAADRTAEAGSGLALLGRRARPFRADATGLAPDELGSVGPVLPQRGREDSGPDRAFIDG